jgi:hypothetical protein
MPPLDKDREKKGFTNISNIGDARESVNNPLYQHQHLIRLHMRREIHSSTFTILTLPPFLASALHRSFNMARSTHYSLLFFSAFAQIIGLSIAADCSQQRKEGDPTGDQIADAITKNNALSNICSGTFSPQSTTDNTWNYWYCSTHLSTMQV